MAETKSVLRSVTPSAASKPKAKVAAASSPVAAPAVAWPTEAPVKQSVPAAPAKAATASKTKPASPARQPVAKKPAPKAAATPRPKPMPVARAAAPLQKEKPMNETVKNVADKAQAQAKTMIDETNARAKGAMDKSQKMFADMNEFTQGNVEAMIESSKIAAKGAEDIAKYSADYARSTVEKANDTARKFATVKSPTELFQLQSEIARGTVDAFAAESAKFTESYLKLVGEMVQPLSNRFALAAEKVKVAA